MYLLAYRMNHQTRKSDIAELHYKAALTTNPDKQGLSTGGATGLADDSPPHRNSTELTQDKNHTDASKETQRRSSAASLHLYDVPYDIRSYILLCCIFHGLVLAAIASACVVRQSGTKSQTLTGSVKHRH